MKNHPLPTIITLVLQETGVTLRELGTGYRRTPDITMARRAIAHLARTYTNASYPQIAQACGGRGHVTYIGAERDAAKLLDPQSHRHDPRFRAMVARIVNRLADKETDRGEEAHRSVPTPRVPRTGENRSLPGEREGA